MIVEHIITAFIIALALTLLFSILLNGRNGRESGFFFFVLFLMMWAGSLWILPAGPVLWGVSWLPLVIFGLVVALILSKSLWQGEEKKTENHHPPNPRDGDKHEVILVGERERQQAFTVSLYFWMVILVLALVIVLGYVIAST